MKAVVTGGAGFIGSGLCEALINQGSEVTVFDNLSVGSRKNLSTLTKDPDAFPVKLVVGDCTKREEVEQAVRDCEVLFHFAANPEVRMELNDPRECYRQNVLATHNVLEAFRTSRAKMIVFASTSTVYGRAKTFPTPEDYSPLEPISFYGASKLAGEAMVSSYCHSFGRQGIILRFANILGPRSTHGVVNDFILKLRQNPKELQILGDGTQTKSYLHIDDSVGAILTTIKNPKSPVEVFNVGSEDQISVRDIATTVFREMGLKGVRVTLAGGVSDGSGWIGDVKNMLLDISRLKSRGWKPSHTSRESIELTVRARVRSSTISS